MRVRQISLVQSFCTKWFEPSILPGPVLPSWVSGLAGSVDDFVSRPSTTLYVGELQRPRRVRKAMIEGCHGGEGGRTRREGGWFVLVHLWGLTKWNPRTEGRLTRSMGYCSNTLPNNVRFRDMPL